MVSDVELLAKFEELKQMMGDLLADVISRLEKMEKTIDYIDESVTTLLTEDETEEDDR